jgi:hypothetical protein
VGGPDFAVEILTPGDRTPYKLPFYAAVNVLELLVIARDRWSLELYRPRERRLTSTGKTDGGGDALVSGVLPLSFHLIAGTRPPMIEVAIRDMRQTWTV